MATKKGGKSSPKKTFIDRARERRQASGRDRTSQIDRAVDKAVGSSPSTGKLLMTKRTGVKKVPLRGAARADNPRQRTNREASRPQSRSSEKRSAARKK